MSNHDHNQIESQKQVRKLPTIDTVMFILMIAMFYMVFNLGNVLQWWQSDPAESNPTARLVTWNLYRSQVGRFEVLLPKHPESWQTSFESEIFGAMTIFHVTAHDEESETTFGVAYHDYPRELTEEEVEHELDYANTLPGTGAEIMSIEEMEIQGLPAFEIASRIGPISQISRYCIVDQNRLYSIHVGSPSDPRKYDEKTDSFFNSFKLQNR